MLNERCLELIHAEIDGTLGPQERAELNRYLLADPEVRRQREDLRAACHALDALEPVALPRDYSDALLATLAARNIPAPIRAPLSFWQRPQLRYAASFGAGVALTVLALGSPAPTDSSHDMRALAGTMVAPAARATDPTVIDTGALSGQVQLEQGADGNSVLRFDLRADGPVDIVAEYSDRTARLGIDGKAGSRFGVMLGESVDTVKVRVLLAGHEVYQTVLHNHG